MWLSLERGLVNYSTYHRDFRVFTIIPLLPEALFFFFFFQSLCFKLNKTIDFILKFTKFILCYLYFFIELLQEGFFFLILEIMFQLCNFQLVL